MDRTLAALFDVGEQRAQALAQRVLGTIVLVEQEPETTAGFAVRCGRSE